MIPLIKAETVPPAPTRPADPSPDEGRFGEIPEDLPPLDDPAPVIPPEKI